MGMNTEDEERIAGLIGQATEIALESGAEHAEHPDRIAARAVLFALGMDLGVAGGLEDPMAIVVQEARRLHSESPFEPELEPGDPELVVFDNAEQLQITCEPIDRPNTVEAIRLLAESNAVAWMHWHPMSLRCLMFLNRDETSTTEADRVRDMLKPYFGKVEVVVAPTWMSQPTLGCTVPGGEAAEVGAS